MRNIFSCLLISWKVSSHLTSVFYVPSASCHEINDNKGIHKPLSELCLKTSVLQCAVNYVLLIELESMATCLLGSWITLHHAITCIWRLSLGLLLVAPTSLLTSYPCSRYRPLRQHCLTARGMRAQQCWLEFPILKHVWSAFRSACR